MGLTSIICSWLGGASMALCLRTLPVFFSSKNSCNLCTFFRLIVVLLHFSTSLEKSRSWSLHIPDHTPFRITNTMHWEMRKWNEICDISDSVRFRHVIDGWIGNSLTAVVLSHLEKQEVGKVFGIDRPQFCAFLIDEKHLLRAERQRFVWGDALQATLTWKKYIVIARGC